MTESEAIEDLKCYRAQSGTSYPEEIEMAIKALKTVQEIKKRKLTIEHIENYMQFEDECIKKGFTFDSLLSARSKMTGIKPVLCMHEASFAAIDYEDGTGEIVRKENNWWRCPCCNAVVGQRVIVHEHIHDQRKKKFCEECGQKIDWEVAKNE